MDYIYSIESIEKIGTAKIFRLVPEGEKLIYKAGQFVKISSLDNSIGRPYSIASAPSSPYLEFLINITGGKFTSILDKMNPGEKLRVSKAAGHLSLNEEKNAAFIAMGVGIAPIISMAREIAEKNSIGNYHVFYSAKTLETAVYAKELEKMAEEGRLTLHLTLTRESIPKYGEGRLSFEKIKEIIPNLSEFSFFICGKSDFANDLLAKLLESSVPREKIKIEGWG